MHAIAVIFDLNQVCAHERHHMLGNGRGSNVQHTSKFSPVDGAIGEQRNDVEAILAAERVHYLCKDFPVAELRGIVLPDKFIQHPYAALGDAMAVIRNEIYYHFFIISYQRVDPYLIERGFHVLAKLGKDIGCALLLRIVGG